LSGDTAVPAAELKGNLREAVWLPSAAVAHAWMEYVRPTILHLYIGHYPTLLAGENNLELKPVRRCSVPGLAGIACRIYFRLKTI
jgi:hypothetical protein